LIKNTIPIHCKNAKGTVRYLVICCIFCCHASHCSDSSSSFGTTEPNNCIIIDALINGASPMAIKEKFSKDHHNIITKYHNHELLISHT